MQKIYNIIYILYKSVQYYTHISLVYHVNQTLLIQCKLLIQDLDMEKMYKVQSLLYN